MVAAAKVIPALNEACAHPVVGCGDAPPVVEMGLDLSSSAVGWAVSVDREHLTRGKIVFSGSVGMGAKVGEFYRVLLTLFRHFQPERVVLEKPVMRHGSSTARHNEMLGIVRLAALDAKIGEISDENMIPPQTVKRCLKVPKGKDHADNKRIMIHVINQKLGLGLRWHRNNKVESDDDIADAVAVLETRWVLDEERRSTTTKPKNRKKAKPRKVNS